MAGLTRMQKFADKREQLANDKEETTQTIELSAYQNRFNNVQETLAPTKEEPQYTWTPFEGDSLEKPVETIKEVPVVENETFEEVNIEEPKKEETSEGYSYFDSFMNEETKDNNKVDDFNSYFEDTQTSEIVNAPIDQNNNDVFEDIKDNSGEIVNIKERDTYLGQTITDVNSYNINNGQQTIDNIVDNSVEEVRHGDFKKEEQFKEPVDNTNVWTPFTEEALDADKINETSVDEEFSNTVSMEISKIMEGVSAISNEEKVEEIVKPVVEETVEEVVEIKNISEMKDEPIKDTMSSTIPFVVAAEDEELIEEDEEEGSNTVLNIILIVLIVVLVAVLGLIVFYILKTKGLF